MHYMISDRIKNKFKLHNLLGAIFSLLFSPAFQFYENNQLKKWKNRKESTFYPVFIIGAPRSGSTMLYQFILNNFEFIYINNLISIFSKNLFLGFKISNLLFKSSKTHPLESKAGNTTHTGWQGPHEAAQFWYQKLPKNKHYLNESDLNKDIQKYYGDYIYGIMNKYKSHFLFKNLNAGLRINLLRRVFPNAKFIFIERDPFYVAQSLLLMRREKGYSNDEWWSLKPLGFKKYLGKSEFEIAAAQTLLIIQQMKRDLMNIEDKNKIILNYSKLTENPLQVLENLNNFFTFSNKIESPIIGNIFNSNRIKLNTTEAQLLRKELNKFNLES